MGGMRKNGICVSQLDYYNNIDKEKFQIDVAAVHNNEKEMIEEYIKAGCRVIELPDRRKKIIQYLKKLKYLLKIEKYDIIHVHGSSTIMFLELGVAKKCGVKVRIAHSRNTTCDRLFLEKILRKKFDKTYNYAIACGEDAGKWLFKDKPFIILHNGKNLEKYRFNENKRKEYRKILNINDEEIAIGHVGLFNEQKNHNFLIDVFNEIAQNDTNVKLFLIGTGPKVDIIKEKVNILKLQDKVIFCGRVNNIEDYLQAMDVMFLPSLFEGLPNVLIEWQASGLSSIISDKITKECVVSDLVTFAPIDHGVEIWNNKYSEIKRFNNEKRKLISDFTCEKLIEHDFEINHNSRRLEEIYYNCINNK